MKKQVLILALVLLSFCMTMQAQDTETKGRRRTFWFGINGNFGGINRFASYGLWDGLFGVTLNTAVSINNTIAVGPYVVVDSFLSEDIAPFAGILTKITFPNDMAFLASYGLGYGEGLYENRLYNQYRIGFKFKYTLYVTGSYLSGEYKGATVGLGFSFGGRKRNR